MNTVSLASFARFAVCASTAWLMACGASTNPGPGDGSTVDRVDPSMDSSRPDGGPPGIDAGPGFDGASGFCATALCGPDMTCCEASMSCIRRGSECPPNGPFDGGPAIDTGAGPLMCGTAICGADQRCCATPAGPVCLPMSVPCSPFVDGGSGGTCGGMTCSATQECCTALGRTACVPRGTCPAPVDAGTCGGMICTATQECCSAGGRQFCAPRGTCSPPPPDAGPTCGGMICTGTQICCSAGGFMACVEPRFCPTGTDGGTGVRCGTMTCASGQECCDTMFGQFCTPAGTCPGARDSGVTDSGSTSFCARALCGAGTYCCEARRACIAVSETCSATPPPMCTPMCDRSQQCCRGVGGARDFCAMRCPTDPCSGVTCGPGYACCGVGRNSGTCQPSACLACCM